MHGTIVQGGSFMKVRYNGGTGSYYGCSKPSKLVVGNVYNVIRMHVMAWQTDFALEGVDGEFNSTWFEEVPSDDKVYMAYSYDVPVVGKSLSCFRLVLNNSKMFVECLTSTVTEVSLIYSDFYYVYQVSTLNSVYIVTIV